MASTRPTGTDSVIVRDECGTGESVTTTRNSVADAIRAWYPEAPAEVTEALDELQAAISRDQFTGDLESFLGIVIEYAE